jgi:hypothetical protein
VPASSETLRKESATRLAAGIFGGLALLAVVNAVAIAVAVPFPKGGVSLRLTHHLFDAAETLGVGATLAIAVGAFVRFVRVPRWVLVGLAFAASVALANRVLGDYLALQASHAVDGRFETAIFANSLAVFGGTLVAALCADSLCSRRPARRLLLVGAAILVMIVDQIPLRDDYMDTHGYLAFAAALLGGSAIATRVERAGRSLTRSRPGRTVLVALGLFALFGIVAPPGNATRFELFRQPCAIASWVLATTVWRAPRLHTPVVPPPSPWLQDRSGAQPVPPTLPPLLPSDAVVVLITIDAVRADIVADPANDARFPTFAKLKREGVVFTHASASGTQTGVSLSALFSGLYYSEQQWKNYGSGKNKHPYPAEDPSLRFPQILSDHDVATANVASLVFLGGDFGVARGFREEKLFGHAAQAAPGFQLIHALLDRLSHPGTGPLFLCTHLVDAHAPYGHGHPGTDYERYLSSVATDDALVGRVQRMLEERFGQRWALFVSADHGEAFGEHETREHAKTLYEELLHVPLLARSPLFQPREIRERVGLIDLGPTILDLFGLATPATLNGQSLVPLLAGGNVALTRPLIAEGRLRQALTEPDGLKVIEDSRRKVVEVYDLGSDPGETRNLFDVEPSRADVALAELRGFFAVHARREGGYEAPYKL